MGDWLFVFEDDGYGKGRHLRNKGSVIVYDGAFMEMVCLWKG